MAKKHSGEAPLRYVDLTQVRMRAVETIGRFFYKHRAFEWERQFRLAISVGSAEEFDVPVPELGIEVSVDLDILIDHIIVGPAIGADERDQLIASATRSGFDDRIRVSSLLGGPRYV